MSKINTTIGVYNNNEWRANGVPDENLADHIIYNVIMRPGRAFFLNGTCIHPGYLSAARVKEWEEKLKANPITRDKDTQPYV